MQYQAVSSGMMQAHLTLRVMTSGTGQRSYVGRSLSPLS
jgi:hypothetical protein